MRLRFVLPLPRFVLHPITSIIIAVVHLYLAAGHLGELVAGNLEWTHVWKGFGALAGAYVFMALASRRMHTDWKDMKESLELSQSQEWRTRSDGSGNYQPQGNFSFQEQVSTLETERTVRCLRIATPLPSEKGRGLR